MLSYELKWKETVLLKYHDDKNFENRRIWLFFVFKIKSSKPFSKPPFQLIALWHIIVTNFAEEFFIWPIILTVLILKDRKLKLMMAFSGCLWRGLGFLAIVLLECPCSNGSFSWCYSLCLPSVDSDPYFGRSDNDITSDSKKRT